MSEETASRGPKYYAQALVTCLRDYNKKSKAEHMLDMVTRQFTASKGGQSLKEIINELKGQCLYQTLS